MTDLRPDDLLGGRYQLVGQIARGGMASVWVAVDNRLTRRVAVKILDPALARDAALRDRFRREAVAAAGLSHPGIVGTNDTGEDGDTVYIVMELIDGQTLRQVMIERGPMPVAEVCDLGAQIAAALDAAHRSGLVHRDVKPGNVLVQRDGRVKVTDFGIAKATGDADLTRTGTIMGTARYLAPEQVEGGVVDPRADVYALGLVLWECLVGEPAFRGDSELATAVARLHHDPPAVRSLRPDVPEALSSAIARATHREVAARTPSAAELRTQLLPFTSDPGLDPVAAHALDVPTAAVALGAATAVAADTTRAVPRAEPTATISRPPAAPKRSSGVAGSILVVVLALAIGLAGGYLVTRQILKNRDATPSGGTATNATAGKPIPIVKLSDFDPDGDGRESPETVKFAIDGTPGTYWKTEHYQQRNLGGLKPGVGLVADLGGDHPVSRVDVVADGTDWNAEIYVSDAAGTTLAAWGTPVASGTGLGLRATFELPAGTTGRDVLLWITRLPASGQLGIDELAVVS